MIFYPDNLERSLITICSKLLINDLKKRQFSKIRFKMSDFVTMITVILSFDSETDDTKDNVNSKMSDRLLMKDRFFKNMHAIDGMQICVP